MKELKLISIIICLAAAACVFAAGCHKPAQTGAGGEPTPSPEAPKTAAAGTGTPDTTATRSVTPPTLVEAGAALERVYKRALVIDEAYQGSPVVGDFNGDGSEDIAIVVRPAGGMLAEINSEFANWIVEDPRRYAPTAPRNSGPSSAPAPGPVKVEQGDALLAIIHGYGPEGWRAAGATQSYLLRNAAGERMRAVPLRSFPPALQVKKDGANSRADIISERLAGVAGFIYWASGKYAWHEE
jgi:hypothetical protein